MGGSAALITGGAGGIGVAVARRLVSAGAVVTLADIDAERGPGVAARMGAAFHRADVTRPEDLVAAVTAAEERGPLRYVHLNAGIAGGGTIEEVEEAWYRRMLGVNLDGVFWGVRAALPALRRAGGGAIVATASLAGIVPVPVDPIYALTKSAVIAIVRALGPDLRGEGIRINCVCPGFVDTPMVPESLRASGFPLLTADDVAGAVLNLFSGDEDSQAVVLQPGREPFNYRFRGVPGAVASGSDGPVTVSARGLVGLEGHAETRL